MIRIPLSRAVALTALVLAGGTAASSAAADLDHPMLGEEAPSFTLPTLSGETLSLPDFRGKYLAIHFGTSW